MNLTKEKRILMANHINNSSIYKTLFILSVFLLLFIIFYCCLSVNGKKLILCDTFSGNDGESPNLINWELLTQNNQDIIHIMNNTTMMCSTDSGFTRIRTNNSYLIQNFTLLLDYKPDNIVGIPFVLSIYAKENDNLNKIICVEYDRELYGWGVYYYQNFQIQHHSSWIKNLKNNIWYSVNITVIDDRLFINILETKSKHNIFQKRLTIDIINNDIVVSFGLSNKNLQDKNPSGYFDNFYLYNLSEFQDDPPIWNPIPTIEVHENIPFVYNFIEKVSDPDTPLSDLMISSDSPFVISINNLSITFLFPNGSSSTIISLILSDTFSSTVIDVPFIIIPKNDSTPLLEIISPINHSIYIEGASIFFKVVITNPDLTYKDLLNVTWLSNISGLIKEITSTNCFYFYSDQLPLGHHRITVEVTNGEYQREAWFELLIIKGPTITAREDGTSTFITDSNKINNYLLIFVPIFILVLIHTYFSRRKKCQNSY